MRRTSGFTFVELLVVITIIAVLMAIATVAYSSTMTKSRDAKRLSDLEQIRSALEICRSEDGYYPINGSVVSGSALTCGGGAVNLSRVPTGPKGDVYNYVRGASTLSYTLTTTDFENVANCPYIVVSGNCQATQP